MRIYIQLIFSYSIIFNSTRLVSADIEGWLDFSRNEGIQEQLRNECLNFDIDYDRVDKQLYFTFDSKNIENNFILSLYFALFDKDWIQNQFEISDQLLDIGFDKIDFISSRKHGLYSFIASNKRIVYIHFRGSSKEVDAKKHALASYYTDIKFHLADAPEFGDSSPLKEKVRLHHGFKEAWESVEAQFFNKLSHHTQKNENGTPIYLGGHSLGGALSTIAAVKLKLSGLNIRGVLNSGQPKVGNQAFALTTKHILGPTYLRLNQLGDPIPLLPLNSMDIINILQKNPIPIGSNLYSHSGRLLFLYSEQIIELKPDIYVPYHSRHHPSVVYFCHIVKKYI